MIGFGAKGAAEERGGKAARGVEGEGEWRVGRREAGEWEWEWNGKGRFGEKGSLKCGHY